MERPKLTTALGWDTNTAVAVVVLAALAVLVAVRTGFRPVLIGA